MFQEDQQPARTQADNATKPGTTHTNKMKSSTEIELIKKNQTETLGLKNTMNRMKNVVESINSRLNQAEERTCELKDDSFSIIQSKEKKRMRKSEKAYTNHRKPSRKQFRHYRRPRRSREGERTESLFKEIMAKKFPNLERDMDI